MARVHAQSARCYCRWADHRSHPARELKPTPDADTNADTKATSRRGCSLSQTSTVATHKIKPLAEGARAVQSQPAKSTQTPTPGADTCSPRDTIPSFLQQTRPPSPPNLALAHRHPPHPWTRLHSAQRSNSGSISSRSRTDAMPPSRISETPPECVSTSSLSSQQSISSVPSYPHTLVRSGKVQALQEAWQTRHPFHRQQHRLIT